MSDSENKMPQNEIVGIDCIKQRDGGVVEYDNIHIMLLLSKYETIVCNLYLVYLILITSYFFPLNCVLSL